MTDIRLNIARDLREIQALYADLRAEAISHADDADIPGGDAMVMLGPSADPEAWSYRQLSAALGRTEPHGIYENDADPQPPLLVLATWEDCIRKELGTETDKRATIEDAAKFLASSIDWCLDVNEFGDVNFIAIDDMAADIAKVRRRLESVLHDGIRPDLSKAKCNLCEAAPRLHKVWTDDPDRDGWKCPNCKEPFDEGQAARALGQMLHAEGSEKFIWLDYARDVAGIDRRTWWSWRDRMKMRMACDLKTRQVIVWWPDVRELVSEHRQRKARLALKRQARAS